MAIWARFRGRFGERFGDHVEDDLDSADLENELGAMWRVGGELEGD